MAGGVWITCTRGFVGTTAAATGRAAAVRAGSGDTPGLDSLSPASPFDLLADSGVNPAPVERCMALYKLRLITCSYRLNVPCTLNKPLSGPVLPNLPIAYHGGQKGGWRTPGRTGVYSRPGHRPNATRGSCCAFLGFWWLRCACPVTLRAHAAETHYYTHAYRD